MSPPTSAPPVRRGARCDRCTTAGRREIPENTSAPYWDPDYRICRVCLAAVLWLLDATGTRPEPAGDGFTSPTSPAHTGAPHYLWIPNKDGLAAQIGAPTSAQSTPERLAGPATSNRPARLSEGPQGESEREAS